jgi:glycosyltransferase involved in cell wall biosynthesis
VLLRGIREPGGPIEPIGASLLAMHEYFQQWDYDTTLRSEQTWDVLCAVFSQPGLRTGGTTAPPAMSEMVGSLRLLYHLLQPICVPVDRCDVAHSSAAAFCGLPCIIAKLKYGVPFLLTEHGVYVREQYLALRRSIKSPFTRQFMCNLVNLVATLNYHHADLVSPVCAYNARWEEWWGVPKNRVRVIFNGADPERFSPGPAGPPSRPLVCNIGLIYPLKGQLDLITAAAYVRENVPDVEFRLYGEASDEEYFATCRQSVANKGLQKTVRFCGQTATPWQAFREADVVAMASVSEAFPYSIIEAMLTGAAVVATDVGGVCEALAGAGVVVAPRQPRELAAALVALLHAPDRRRKLGEAARERAIRHFTVQTFAAAYRQAYQDLSSRSLSSLAQAS